MLQKLLYYLVDAFNKTALGLTVLTAIYLFVTGWYVLGAVLFIIGVPVYFALYDRFGGIPDELE